MVLITNTICLTFPPWVDLPLRTALGDEDCVPLDPEQEEGGEEERPHGVLAGDWLHPDPTLHTLTW